MKKNKKEKCWWSGLTAEDMTNISNKRPPKTTSAKSQEWDISGIDCYADVVRSPKKSPKKKISVMWGNEYSDVDRSPKKSKKSKRK
jgi:hypothetical protein